MKPDINTCFVISPISEEGSAIRAEADKLLWVIKNVAEKHAFKAIRVDEVAGTTVISDEIKSFITQSGMCVCVLTESNPNVFYETGLRHSTKKPFIHLMRKGNDIPFDLKGINTIFYGDINSFDEVKALSERLDSFFAVEKERLTETEEKDKLDTLLDALKAISLKIDSLRAAPPNIPVVSPDGLSLDEDPFESYLLAIAQSNIEAAESIYPSVLARIGGTKEKLATSQRLAQIGGLSGITYILEHYQDDKEISMSELMSLLGSVVEGVGRVHQHLAPNVIAILDVLIKTNEENRHLCIRAKNQKQKLLYAAGKYEEALVIAEDILNEEQKEPAFYFNASLIYEKLKLPQKAKAAVEKMLALGSDDPNHLSQAIDVFILAGETEKAKEYFATLKKVDPRTAAIKALDSDFRRSIGLARR